jgi:hypothetical protein
MVHGKELRGRAPAPENPRPAAIAVAPADLATPSP